MDEEVERLLVSVRADTAGFARDVADMRGQLEGPLAAGAERAGRVLEGALLRAVRTGSFGFDDLKRVALAALSEIATAAVRSGVGAASGGGGQSGLGAIAAALITSLAGAPGRSTGGAVAAGRAYRVGERGPEWFVPTASGRVEAAPTAGPGRDVRVSITVHAPSGAEPAALAQSGRQVARAVKAALMRVDP